MQNHRNCHVFFSKKHKFHITIKSVKCSLEKQFFTRIAQLINFRDVKLNSKIKRMKMNLFAVIAVAALFSNINIYRSTTTYNSFPLFLDHLDRNSRSKLLIRAPVLWLKMIYIYSRLKIHNHEVGLQVLMACNVGTLHNLFSSRILVINYANMRNATTASGQTIRTLFVSCVRTRPQYTQCKLG